MADDFQPTLDLNRLIKRLVTEDGITKFFEVVAPRVRAAITTAVLSVQPSSVLFLQFKQSKRAAALLAQSKSGLLLHYKTAVTISQARTMNAPPSHIAVELT
jgi:hypothetical protein